jgi:hypothetical protein
MNATDWHADDTMNDLEILERVFLECATASSVATADIVVTLARQRYGYRGTLEDATNTLTASGRYQAKMYEPVRRLLIYRITSM